MDSHRQPTEQTANSVTSIFLFDRDDTLVDKKWELINRDRICSSLQHISFDNTSRWGIVSAGGTELAVDEAYLAIKKNVSLGSEPVYVTFNRNYTLAKCATSITDGAVAIEIDGVTQDLRNEELTKIAIDALFNARDFKFNEFIQLKSGKVKIDDHAELTMQFGNTRITLDIKRFNDSLRSFAEGDYKLFAVIMALDQANLCIDVNDNLRGLGIIKIEAPASYEMILSGNVYFIDDKNKNCASVRSAGFVAIDADTREAKSHKDDEKHDTYLDHLEQVLKARLMRLDVDMFSTVGIYHWDKRIQFQQTEVLASNYFEIKGLSRDKKCAKLLVSCIDHYDEDKSKILCSLSRSQILLLMLPLDELNAVPQQLNNLKQLLAEIPGQRKAIQIISRSNSEMRACSNVLEIISNEITAHGHTYLGAQVIHEVNDKNPLELCTQQMIKLIEFNAENIFKDNENKQHITNQLLEQLDGVIDSFRDRSWLRNLVDTKIKILLPAALALRQVIGGQANVEILNQHSNALSEKELNGIYKKYIDVFGLNTKRNAGLEARIISWG